MDNAIIILIIILLFILGIYGFSQMSGSESDLNSNAYNSYPSQYGGGGCIR